MSRDQRLKNTLAEHIGPLAESAGLELWGLEFIPGSNRAILRVYVDGKDGVTIDELAKLSRHIGDLLDVEDAIPGRYNLEVSSPGLDRIFFNPRQMVPFLGQEATVALHQPQDGRKNFKGRLASVEGDVVGLEVDGIRFSFEWSDVKKARLHYDFSKRA